MVGSAGHVVCSSPKLEWLVLLFSEKVEEAIITNYLSMAKVSLPKFFFGEGGAKRLSTGPSLSLSVPDILTCNYADPCPERDCRPMPNRVVIRRVPGEFSKSRSKVELVIVI